MGLNRTMQYGNYVSRKNTGPANRFKSYYVVWKLFGFFDIISWMLSLNRTMQYGNFVAAQILFAGPVLFKSYYVVWKLTLGKNLPLRPCPCLNRTMQYGNCMNAEIRSVTEVKFKSYYVVWKPTFSHVVVARVRFKSYYVVWKLIAKQLNRFDPNYSLNRTMQYGNFHFISFHFKTHSV